MITSKPMTVRECSMFAVKRTPVYSNGRGQYSLTKSETFWARPHCEEFEIESRNSKHRLDQAEKQLGVKCYWEYTGDREVIRVAI